MSVSKQCKSCNQPEDIRQYMDDLRRDSYTYAEIARLLAGKGVSIADTSVGNHYNKHAVHIVPRLSLPKFTVERGGIQYNTPKGWSPGVELNEDGTGIATSIPQDDDNISDYSDILRQLKVDPDAFEVIGSARISRWQSGDKWLTSYRVNIQKKNVAAEEEPLPLLVNRATKFGQTFEPCGNDFSEDRTLVVVGGDFQVGKVGSRGNTTDLIDRMRRVQGQLEDVIAERECINAVYLDAGDIVEGFDNVAAQMHGNDLSIMEQVDLAHTLELEFIDLLASQHDNLDVMSVPSNHAAWRKGKDYLGKPSDDWGRYR